MKFGKTFAIGLILFLAMIPVLAMIPITVADVPSTSTIPGIPNQRTTDSPREETMWMAGSYNGAGGFIPWSTALHPGSDAGMYEALFGRNTLTGTDVPCIGTSYTWGVTGENITIELHPNATWSDGHPIDASDVAYSFELAGNQTRYKTDFALRFADFVAVDADTVRFDMNPGFEYSRQVEVWIKGNIPIIPEHIWRVIAGLESDQGDFSVGTFQYDWFDPLDTPDAWKVISGPYAPVYRNAMETTCIYQYRGEDWWGHDILYTDLPNYTPDQRDDAGKEGGIPKYLASNAFWDNPAQDLAFISGTIDLFAGYYAEIWEVWENAAPGSPQSYVTTWYGHDPPYILAASALMNLNPNHELVDSPLGVAEFREALAYAINYAPIPGDAASGYWTQAKPGWLDDNSVLHQPYYNASITTEYGKYLNVSKAIAILESIPGMSGNVTDGWSYMGTPVGPYEAITPTGWTDATAFTTYVTDDIRANLNIDIQVLEVPFDPNYQDRVAAKDFDFCMGCVGNRLADPPARFLDYLRGEHLWNKNQTSWYNPEYNYLWNLLDAANESAYTAYLNRMQEIIAQEVPEIAGFVNGYWYAVSEYQWEGWATEDNDFQQIITTWTDDQFVMKTRLMLNLVNTGRTPGEAAIPWFALELYILIGVISITLLTVFKLKRKR
ncbi:MAG: ABC transporter substrate-binding protein [Candidatus Hermodarchaeota archaeon]